MDIKGFVGLILFSPIIAFIFLTYGLHGYCTHMQSLCIGCLIVNY